MTGFEVVALIAGSSAIAALVQGLFQLASKRTESQTQVTVTRAESERSDTTVVVDALGKEVDRKEAEIQQQDAKIAGQDAKIAELQLIIWLVLQHILDVHRHFAEGNPPPPPPMPSELLDALRGAVT